MRGREREKREEERERERERCSCHGAMRLYYVIANLAFDPYP